MGVFHFPVSKKSPPEFPASIFSPPQVPRPSVKDPRPPSHMTIIKLVFSEASDDCIHLTTVEDVQTCISDILATTDCKTCLCDVLPFIC